IQGSLQRTVALKVMHPQASAGDHSRARFRREAESAASLHHTNIVPVYGSGEDHGLLYYAMQLIAGPTLAQVITALRVRRSLDSPAEATFYPLNHPTDSATNAATDPTTIHGSIIVSIPTVPSDYQRFICRLVAQVASALDYAHQSGVLHRDIKPDNLLLDSSGTIWVADFGLAHRADLDGHTQAGEFLGTLRYMAPEQLTGQIDSRCDIYSLGLTLFELLTLRPAIEAPKKRLLPSAPPAQLEFTPTEKKLLSRDLQTIVHKATAIEPERRYQQARDLQEDLQRLLDDRPIRARRPSLPEIALRWSRRNPAIALLTTTLFAALLLIVLMLGVWNQQQRDSLAELRRANQDTANSLRERTAALEQAESERRRATQNLELALEAFQTITENIAARGRSLELQDLEQAELDSLGFADAVLTQADVELLNSLQRFFERFAEENATDLRLEAAIARRRVGEIEIRIGKYDQAARSLTSALTEFKLIRTQQPSDQDIDRLLREELRVRDELIRLAVRRDQFTKAQGDMERLREVLQQYPQFAASNHGRHALATSLISLSSGSMRPTFDRGLSDR
ncbi:MAG: serine/threonine protein kinase, partial [Planctomycetota bacterium]